MEPEIYRVKTNAGIVWRVCVAGICKEHWQDWQARVFYHALCDMYGVSNPSALEDGHDESQDEQNPY